MSRDFTLLLMGATIALVSGLITALVQHRLSLRRERFKRDWEKEDRNEQEHRIRLLENTQLDLGNVKRKLMERELRMLHLDVKSRDFDMRQKFMDRGLLDDEKDGRRTLDMLGSIGRELSKLREDVEKDIEEMGISK